MKHLFTLKVAFIAILTFLLFSCSANKAPKTNVRHADWLKDAVLYEVNLRQYTPGSSLREFETHIDRLHQLGVDILWFMPVHPIGVVERKGELGSYYSVRDYKDINPEFGDLEDFRRVVEKAHSYGMKVILDWVANHTSRDHNWVTEHPDWYNYDDNGVIIAPYEWSDVADLNFDNPQMREGMHDALKFWIEEYGIDGYRCDVAWGVPVDFWDEAFARLREIREDLFFLAEAEDPALVIDAFDAYYGWEIHHAMNKLAKGEMDVAGFKALLNDHAERFPADAIQLNFITNHDENSWNGTEFERLGGAVKQMAVLSFVLPGMPLIYTGQEVGLSKRLEFFIKDTVNWEDPENYSLFYKNLIAMRDAHPAMYAPAAGAPIKILEADNENVLAFRRSNNIDSFTAIFNFSSEPVTVQIEGLSYNLEGYGYKIVF